MSAYDLSVVLLIPDAQRELINQYAESIGWGPNNLSVELVHTDSSTWWGCHTMADAGFLELMSSPPEPDAEVDYMPALAVLVSSVVPGGNPLDNWTASLEANGLSQVITGEVMP